MLYPLYLRLTAYVLKVLAMVAERQKVSFGAQGRKAVILPEEQISHTVSYLLSVQNTHGSFTDQFPVLHRGVLVSYFKRLCTCIHVLTYCILYTVHCICKIYCKVII